MKKVLLYFILLCFTIDVHAQTWNAVGGAGFSPDTVYNTSIAIDGSGTPYVAYLDVYNSIMIPAGPDNYYIAYPATVMKYNGSSWETLGTAGFSGAASCPSIAIRSYNMPYVAFSQVDGGGRPMVMEYVGGWGYVYGSILSPYRTYYTSIAIDGNGRPYVVYNDGGAGGKATVMEYNGMGWVAIGGTGFSAGYEQFNSIAIDKSNTLYVVYQDYGNGGKATVMKFTGSTWVNVGSAGFSDGFVQYTSIAIDTSGTPYVVYQDTVNGWKATVMKYNGSSWVNVGTAGFSIGKVQYTTIAIDPSGIPYVAYKDLTTNMATVMKYNGTNWLAAGSGGLSAGAYTSIAMDTGGTPYVVYQDGDNSWKATVKKLGTATGINNIAVINKFTIYPNPTNSQLTISAPDNITSIIFSNLLGQVVYSNQYNSPQVEVDVADLPAGVYFVKVNGVEVRKFVKQ